MYVWMDSYIFQSSIYIVLSVQSVKYFIMIILFFLFFCLLFPSHSFFFSISYFLYCNFLEHSVAAKTGGCFPGNSLVTSEGGVKKMMRDLRPGERVLASSGSDGSGELLYSEVVTFLDRQPDARKSFYTLGTALGTNLTLTAAHLVFVTDAADCSRSALTEAFASDVRPGQCVLTTSDDGEEPTKKKANRGRLTRVTWVEVREGMGAFAPLTRHGTLVVDDVLASCYATVDQQWLAHWALAPLRALHRLAGPGSDAGTGTHWYARLLHWVASVLLDPSHFHPWGMAAADG